MTAASELAGRCTTEERGVCFGTQRRAWKALSRLRRSRRPLRRPHSARRGPRERPVAAWGEPGVSAQWPARCLGQKSRSRPLGSAPERVRLGGEARGGERRESDWGTGEALRVVARAQQIVRTKAESQRIVATRPLCRVQYPVPYSSRLQGIRRPGSVNCGRSRLRQCYRCSWRPRAGRWLSFRHGF